jgi:hypothetical protein
MKRVLNALSRGQSMHEDTFYTYLCIAMNVLFFMFKPTPTCTETTTTPSWLDQIYTVVFVAAAGAIAGFVTACVPEVYRKKVWTVLFN